MDIDVIPAVAPISWQQTEQQMKLKKCYSQLVSEDCTRDIFFLLLKVKSK